MRAKDITVGQAYLTSTSNDWAEYGSQIERKIALSPHPFIWEPRRHGTEPVTVQSIAPDAPEQYANVQTVRTGDVKPSSGWTKPYKYGTAYAGVLMVTVDEDGTPTGPAHVVSLRTIRATYDDGTALIRETQAARAADRRAARLREHVTADRFVAARDKVKPAHEYTIRCHDGDVRMPLAEFERIAALAAAAIADRTS